MLVPGVVLINRYLGRSAALVVTLLFVNSLLTGIVVLINGTSRVIYAMSQKGIVPKRLSKLHPSYRTPTASAVTVAFSAATVGIISYLVLGGIEAFIMAASAATLGVILVHVVVNISLPSIERKFSGRYGSINIVASAISIIIFAFIFYSSFLQISTGLETGILLFVMWTIIASVSAYRIRKKFTVGRAPLGIENDSL